jgi:hypothetical protein
LDVEAWRDSLLQVTEGLSYQIGGPSQELGSMTNARRTLYGHVRRREVSDLLRLFDFPDPLTHSPTRIPTITPLQQLYVLNSRFVIERSEALIARLDREGIDDVQERIRRLHRWLYQREPTEREFARIKEFVQVAPDRWQLLAQTLLASNEFYFCN